MATAALEVYWGQLPYRHKYEEKAEQMKIIVFIENSFSQKFGQIFP